MEKEILTFDWFIRARPDQSRGSYNHFYFNLCRDIFQLLQKIEEEHQTRLQESQLREIALVFSGYFEDVKNGIGYWNAVMREHQRLYGQRIPFFSPEQLKQWEEAYQDIHPADIHYLLLIYVVNWQHNSIRFSMPEEQFFTDVRDRVIGYLNEIQEVERSSFYEGYLASGRDYWDFMNKFRVFMARTYLFGYVYERKMREGMKRYFIAHAFELREKYKGKSNHEILNTFEVPDQLVSQLDQQIMSENAMLSAVFPLDIFVEALRISDVEKAELKRLKDTRITGIFEMTDLDERHFTLKHGGTGQVYHILKDSLAEDVKLPSTKYVRTEVNYWKGTYIVTDFVKPEPEVDEYALPIAIAENEMDFFRHDPVYREKYNYLSSVSFECAMEHFGDHLTRYKDRDSMLPVFNAYLVKEHALHTRLGLTKAPKPLVFTKADFFDNNFTDICILLRPDNPITFTEHTEKFIRFLSNPCSFYDCIRSGIFEDNPYPPEFHKEIWRRFIGESTSAVNLPICDEKTLDAVLRIYKYEAYNHLLLPSIPYSLIEYANMR
jgi:hypothetical protein